MIIITGASRGIGRYLFSEFKKAGEYVIGTYYNTNTGLDKDIESYFKVDISEYASVKNWIKTIQNHLQNLVLINCAGISYNSYAHKANVQKWENVININLLGTFYVIHNLLPHMRTQNYGRIINFSSIVAQVPTPGVSAYAASKSALWGLTKTLAIENGSKGITVNSINLGYSNIGMGVNEVPKDFLIKLLAKIPSNRFCTPEEIFLTVKFLIDNAYVNGASIDINGGLI